MLYREIIAVCSEIHTKHVHALCGQHVEFVMLQLVLRNLWVCKVSATWHNHGIFPAYIKKILDSNNCDGIQFNSAVFLFLTQRNIVDGYPHVR